MPRKPKLFQQLLRQELRHAGDSDSRAADFLVPFEERFVRAVEDEEGVDVQGEEAQQAVVEGSQGWVGAAFAGLDLEEPDADVDCEAEGAGMCGVVLGAEFGEGDALAGADVFEDAAWSVSDGGRECFGGGGGATYP